MPLFGKKKSKDKKDEKGQQKAPKEYVICPHCYLDFTVKQIEQAGGACPSCKGEIDLEKLPRARL